MSFDGSFVFTAAFAALWWSYSLYWWRHGRIRAIERVNAMPRGQKAEWQTNQRTVMSAVRFTLWILPFGGVLMAAFNGTAGPWAVLLVSASFVLIWLSTADFYLRTRYVLRRASESEPGGHSYVDANNVRDGRDKPSAQDESPWEKRFAGLALQQWVGIAIGNATVATSFVLWLALEGRESPRDEVVVVGALSGVTMLIATLISIRKFIIGSAPQPRDSVGGRGSTGDSAPSQREELTPSGLSSRTSGLGLIVVTVILLVAVLAVGLLRLVD